MLLAMNIVVHRGFAGFVNIGVIHHPCGVECYPHPAQL